MPTKSEAIILIIWIAILFGLCRASFWRTAIYEQNAAKATAPYVEPETATEPATTQIETAEAVICTEPASTYVYGFSAYEQDLLVKVAYLEAGNQQWPGMALVMNVIINRSNHSGLTIEQVIYSPGQFAVVDMIDGCIPSAEAYEALNNVMNGWDASMGALYFCSPSADSWHKSHLEYLFTGYGHEFFK